MRAMLLMGCMALCRISSGSDYRAVDVDGKAHELLNIEKKATVLIFITNDCPIANSYAPEINRICAQYASKGIEFYMIHVDPTLSTEVARKHAADFGFKCPVLIDPKHELVRLTGAKVTPEAFVLSPKGEKLYRGRIDDRYVDFGKARAEAKKHDLREALDAVVAGELVKVPATSAVGCFIPETQ